MAASLLPGSSSAIADDDRPLGLGDADDGALQSRLQRKSPFAKFMANATPRASTHAQTKPRHLSSGAGPSGVSPVSPITSDSDGEVSAELVGTSLFHFCFACCFVKQGTVTLDSEYMKTGHKLGAGLCDSVVKSANFYMVAASIPSLYTVLYPSPVSVPMPGEHVGASLA